LAFNNRFVSTRLSLLQRQTSKVPNFCKKLMKSELFRSELLLTRRFENMQRDVSQELFLLLQK